ncbi:MAG: fluoride efflux transporter CrcB [Dehalococcoidia bacterium]|nr:MAG: fluoride efflux transporter CrcB [Dehalococcoidia bacterium]
MVLVLFVGAGGFLGSIARYLLSGWVQRATQDSWFPYGTMSVNLLGCLVIGILAGLAESRGILTPNSRAFLLIGVLGGFTTFSSFSYDTASLFSGGRTLAALLNITVQVILGVAATWLSYHLVQRIGGPA